MSGHYLVGMARQRREKLKLGSREANVLVPAQERATFQVQTVIPEGDDCAKGIPHLGMAADRDPNPSEEFGNGERFRQIVNITTAVTREQDIPDAVTVGGRLTVRPRGGWKPSPLRRSL
jgi:hypothetical protein